MANNITNQNEENVGNTEVTFVADTLELTVPALKASHAKYVSMANALLKSGKLDDAQKAIKVNNYDVAFIEETFGKLNKKAKMTVSFAKNDELCNLLLDVILRLTTNGKYDFDAKMKS